MKKILLYIIPFIVINSIYAQNKNNSLNVLAQAKVQQVAIERSIGNQQTNSVNSLPEQDLSGAIPVCQNSYSVSNSYTGAGLISEINNVNTCLGTGEKNSVWYSFSSYSVGRLKFTITPNTLSDDYDFVLYDVTGYSFSDIQNGVVIPVRCNFSATGGKTGLDSVGTNNSEPAAGPNFNPLLNLISGRKYMLNISNFTGSTFGYKLDFTGTTANIGGSNSSIQSVVSYCGADSVTVNLSSPILISSIAINGSDFTLASSSGTYNVIGAQGIGSNLSASIVLKLGSTISGAGTYSLNLVNGTDGNTLLNSCNNSAVGISTFTFNNSFINSPPTTVCQNQSFTVSATPANSYTWTGALVAPAEINNQSLSITSNTAGNFTFTLATTDNCGTNTKSFAVTVNPLPNTQITTTTTLTSCAGSVVNLQASGATNYLWSVATATNDGNSTQYQTATSSPTFFARPLRENVYNVTGINGFGCSNMASYTLTALAGPTLSIAGPDTICVGTAAILNYSGNADTYTWTAGGVINTPTLSVAPTSSYNYILKGTNTTTGCKTQVSKYITVIGIVNIVASKSTICIGDSTVLSALGASSYTWSNSVTSSSITVKPPSTTTYTVFGNTASCGVMQSIKTIIVNPLPNLTIYNNPVCMGVGGWFSVAHLAALNYTWSTGTTGMNIEGVFLTPTLSATSYTNIISVIAISSDGCKNTNSLTYTVNPNPIINTSFSSGICVGDTSLLTASGASTYTWSPGNMINNSIVVSPTVSTTYTVVGKSAEGCTNTQSVTIGISSSSSVNVVASPSAICAGKTTSLVATGNGIIKWYNSDTTTQYIATGLSYNTPTLSAGTHTYYASSTCSGNVRSPVVINVLPIPTITISASSYSVCANTPFQLISTGANTYTWTSPNPYFNIVNDTLIKTQTNYQVQYNVSGTNGYGCVGSNSISIKLFPTYQPTTITATPSLICEGGSSTLKLVGATSYTWSNGIISNTAVVTPSIQTTYSVNFTTNEGCVQLSYVTVNLDNPSIYINGLTTNTLCAGTTKTLSVIGLTSYTWSTGNINANIVITPTNSTVYTYSVNGLTSNGCLRNASITFTVYPTPNVIITATKDTVCMGSAATMTATGATNYTWSNNSTNTTYYPGAISVPTTYSVMGTNSYGCKQGYVKNIGVYSIIQATAVVSPATTVCLGQSVLISAAGVPNYTISGYGGPYNTPKAVYPSSSTSVYYLNAKDVHGCSSTSSISVTSNGSAYFNVSSSYTVCSGAQLNLSVSNNTLSYSWSPTVTPLSSTFYTTTASTTTTGITYTVIGSNPTCSITQTISVPVVQSPTVSIVANNTITCATPTIQIFATASGSVSYQWTRFFNNMYYIQSSTTPTVNVTIAGIYYCQVTNTVTSCVKSVSCQVYSNTTPLPITITFSPASICKGQSCNATVTGASTYSWSSGATTPSINVNPTVTTNYTVTGSGANGCISTAYKQLVVNPNPTVSIAGAIPICNGTSISLTSNGASSYIWNTGASSSSIVVAPTIATTYSVVGTNTYGCVGSTTTQVIVNPNPTVSISGVNLLCEGATTSIKAIGATSYTWNTGATTDTLKETIYVTTIYSVIGSDVNNCTGTATTQVMVNPMPSIGTGSDYAICLGDTASMYVYGANTYTWSTGETAQAVLVTPTVTTTYSVIGTDLNNCTGTMGLDIIVYPNPTLTVTSANICQGTSAIISVSGTNIFYWNTGETTSSINVSPTITDTYTVVGTDLNNCSTTQTVSVIVDSTCADVWPGDANSDGIADNLDVLELGLHYTQTGAPRASTSNSWQSYFANNWAGTITNGKNLNHSDCNGDGSINDDDTLAIYTNYSLTHAFKTAQTTTVNPQLSIVPDQSAVVKGTWGTASVYLGDATTNINNINGVAFTVYFDNTLIEPNSIYIEYQNSFIDASQNLHFRKLAFANGKIFTATTHTVNYNVSGFGKIATLHYQILSSLATDQTLTIGLTQANQSDASGLITPLTSGTGTLMAVGSSVGIKEVLNNSNISISPNPTNGVLNIVFSTIPQNIKIEVYNSIGALVLTEVVNNKNNTINTSYLSDGMYLIKVLENNRVTFIQKIVKQ